MLVISGVALVLSACGGGDSAQQDAKARPLPQTPGALRPGEYHSVVFKPSLSFHVGKGWANTKAQLPDSIEVGEVEQQEETGWINIVNVKEVFKPGTRDVVECLRRGVRRLRPRRATRVAARRGDHALGKHRMGEHPGHAVGRGVVGLAVPDGRPPNRELWAVVWMALGGAALMALAISVSPGPMNNYDSVQNPFGVSRRVHDDVMWPLGMLGAVVLLVSWLASVISLHLRLDGARDAEREQIKWFAYAAALLLFGLFVGLPLADARGGPWATFTLLVIGFSLLPVAVGFAIFRHHLYDVNVAVNRALVYGSLTVLLALVYFGGVTATKPSSNSLPTKRSYRSSPSWPQPS